jgi:hypothetical protein
MKIFFSLFLLALATSSSAQHHHRDRVIEFPDVPGFLSLETDLHIHTVFSDGNVWPTIRVEEASRDGLDVIAMTDHIEYQPHKEDIPHPNRNRSYDLAAAAASESDLIVIKGSEITRSMPPGHSNAIFLEDANALLVDDPMDAFRAAKQQGAFIFWNHPMWEAQASDGVARLSDLHRQLIQNGLLNGIEVVNDITYSDEALQIALDHNLTILGTSDIHGLVDWQFGVPEGGHRPITVVLAEERTAEAVRDALFAGRTVVWYEEVLVGKEENILPLLRASIEASSKGYEDDTAVYGVELKNNSSAEFILRSTGGHTFHDRASVFTLKPHETLHLRVKTLTRMDVVEIEFEVLSAVSAPGTHPVVRFDVRRP